MYDGSDFPDDRTGRFNGSHTDYSTVEKIYNSVQTDTGVSMDWMDGRRKTREHFSFSELESMRIKIPALISNPELFRIDLLEHKIYVSQVGRGV
jgi:hypothetical protein